MSVCSPVTNRRMMEANWAKAQMTSLTGHWSGESGLGKSRNLNLPAGFEGDRRTCGEGKLGTIWNQRAWSVGPKSGS